MVRDAVNSVLSVVLAPPCAACARPLDAPLDGAVCEACWRGIRPLRRPFCSVCCTPLPSWRAEPAHRCELCCVRRSHVAAGRSIGDYEGPLRAMVHALKYDGRRSIAGPLGALLRRHGSEVLCDADLVVPVPLHWARRWRRGFNQAHELAVALGLPIRGVLRRRRHTRSQTGLSADERSANVRNAFAISRRCGPLEDLCVVLVDDVSTTGATLEACARALKEAGAREVRTLTAARVATAPPPARRR